MIWWTIEEIREESRRASAPVEVVTIDRAYGEFREDLRRRVSAGLNPRPTAAILREMAQTFPVHELMMEARMLEGHDFWRDVPDAVELGVYRRRMAQIDSLKHKYNERQLARLMRKPW